MFLEIKNEIGVVSKVQQHIIDQINTIGFNVKVTAKVVRGVEDI